MSITDKWDHPAQDHIKGNDLDALREDIWASFFFAVASIGAFQIGWNLEISWYTGDRLDQRQWDNPQNNRKARISWDYSGDSIFSVTFLWYNGSTLDPTIPAVCTPVYDADGLLESYSWSNFVAET